MCNCKNIKMGSYDNQVTLKMPNGQLMGIDKCISKEIKYLWSINIKTTGCCCGHNIKEGYIGVIEKDIEFMKKLGYGVHFNKQNLNDESNFIPKSHYEGDKLEYSEYENLYRRGGVIVDTGYYERLIRNYVRSCLSTKIIGESVEDCTVSFKVKSGDFEINNTFTVTKKEVEKWKKDKANWEI